ncbi:tyrosine-protein phosphatase [Rubrimonas sp.]|uniref:tyrosine-protein phosphatase n=1 Tax=Rubrimonas sp. TaxID=2036015 RepID=UPI002FDC849E
MSDAPPPAAQDAAFDRILNFRDVGGYAAADGRRVRRGRIFRSADLSDASAQDVARLSALGLRLVCDFRTVDEARKEPDRLPPGVAYVNAALEQTTLTAQDAAALRSGDRSWFDNGGMTRIYLSWIDVCAPLWSGVLDRVAERAELPLLVHCMAGKDRTGVFVALLLSVLGVAEEDILHDHQLSNRAMPVLRKAARMHAERAGDKPEMVLPTLAAPAEALRAFLGRIREDHGGVDAYLRARGGLNPTTVAMLRDAVLEA